MTHWVDVARCRNDGRVEEKSEELDYHKHVKEMYNLFPAYTTKIFR
jgi:hypothetical protein